MQPTLESQPARGWERGRETELRSNSEVGEMDTSASAAMTRGVRTTLLAVLVSMVLAVGAPPANAITVVSTEGDPGTVSLDRALMVAAFDGAYLFAGGGWFSGSPRYPDRDQWMCLKARFFRLNVVRNGRDGWEKVHQQERCTWIPAGKQVGFGLFTAWYKIPDTDRYSVDVKVRWKLSPHAVNRIGWAHYDLRARGDYLCGAVHPCTIGYNTEVNAAFIRIR